MSLRIQMNEADVEMMIDLIRKSCDELRELQSALQPIATQLDEEALKGRVGDLFAAAINQRLLSALQQMEQDGQDISHYLFRELEQYRSAKAISSDRYSR